MPAAHSWPFLEEEEEKGGSWLELSLRVTCPTLSPSPTLVVCHQHQPQFRTSACLR